MADAKTVTVKNIAAWEDKAVAEFRKFFRAHFKNMETGLKGSSSSATLSFATSCKERKDTTFAVKFKGKADIPWAGDECKAEIRDGQLQLI